MNDGDVEKPKKLMVVDDDIDIIALIETVLQGENIEVTGVCRGLQCLEVLEDVHPDALLLDIMMPGMDGWETFHKIKEKYSDLPVAILTAKDQEFDKMMGLEVLGADDYITKPFNVDEFISNIRSLLRTVDC